MDRVAVFVDAGYLFAQGGAALDAANQPRSSFVLNPKRVIELLKALALQKAAGCQLLRVYWYDGVVIGSPPSADQSALAHLHDVKLRLGFINSHGKQKGVDSLIVTDLIELARQKSICDALLLSGDEDIRIGVQIAQNYGVRVHLLGIHPSRGSQSYQLMQESDTTAEWMPETIKSFLSVREAQSPVIRPRRAAPDKRDGPSLAQTASNTQDDLAAAALNLANGLTEVEISGVREYWKTERGVPPDMDRRLLPMGREALGRDLERPELKFLRDGFRIRVENRLGEGDEN
jgi:uncharacterized LabA/DUF88 family protein